MRLLEAKAGEGRFCEGETTIQVNNPGSTPQILLGFIDTAAERGARFSFRCPQKLTHGGCLEKEQAQPALENQG